MLGSVAVLDACVLYPASLRDFLMRLATARLYSPRWSAKIHEEWTRNLLASRPDIPPAQLARTQSLMDMALPSALVTGYESRIDDLTLPDPDDRHVLAAAIESQATVIVTFNLRHFPAARLAPYGITAMPPDAFTLELYKATPEDFLQAVQIHRASLTRPPKTAEEYLAALAHGQLPQTSAVLKAHIAKI
jgi:predicted nucleic acid-binding protein